MIFETEILRIFSSYRRSPPRGHIVVRMEYVTSMPHAKQSYTKLRTPSDLGQMKRFSTVRESASTRQLPPPSTLRRCVCGVTHVSTVDVDPSIIFMTSQLPFETQRLVQLAGPTETA